MNFSFGDVVKAGMGVGVIADLMAFGVFALHDLRKLAGVDTDYEKRCRNVFLLEDVEDFGSPAEVGAIVEGDGDFVVGRANLVDVVGERIGFVFLAGKEVAGGIVNETAHAAFGRVGEMPDVTVAFKDQVGARGNVF